MKTIKTLTVGGETYALAHPDDTQVGSASWSSKKIVDTLCPAFEKTGAVVTCNPVAGYPLEVSAQKGATVFRCGKNLINPLEYMSASDDRSSLNGDVFTTNFTSGGLHLNIAWGTNPKWHPKGTYTVSFLPITEGGAAAAFVYSAVSGSLIAKNVSMDAANPYFTFTANEAFILSVGGNNVFYGNCAYKLQLEVGAVATDYAPYNGDDFAEGEAVLALPGDNVLYADKGEITVVGRADLCTLMENFLKEE